MNTPARPLARSARVAAIVIAVLAGGTAGVAQTGGLPPSALPAQVGSLPDAPRVTGTQPTGTGRVSGQVVAADSGAPVRRTVVSLNGMARSASPSGFVEGGIAASSAGSLPTSAPARDPLSAQPTLPPGMVSRQAETDDAGRFEFTDLPAGQFSVGIASPPTAFVRPEKYESVRLSEGQSATVTFRLARTGAITGRVLDESGEPLARVNVQAMRRDATTGGRLMGVSSGYATTDDLGQFRLYGLPAGEYYVVGMYTGPQTVIVDPRAVTAPAARMGYAPTYYPGSATAEGGRRVAVRSGQDTAGIEFSLQRVTLGRIVGTAVDSKGAPLMGYAPVLDANGRAVRTTQPADGRGSITVSSREQPNFGRGAGMRADGTFQVNDLPPGDYTVVATLMKGQGPAAEREVSFTEVTVNGNEVTVNLQTNRGATLTGRVIVEGDTDAAALGPTGRPIMASPIRVMVRPDLSQPTFVGGSSPSVQVADDGTFEIKGVWGAARLNATGGRGVLKSVFVNGQDITCKPMTLKGVESVGDIVVTMTTETGSIQGTVTDSQGEPVSGARVIIFPDAPDHWFSGSPFVTYSVSMQAPTPPPSSQQTAAPAQQAGGAPAAPQTRFLVRAGAFRTPRLLPGRYLLVAMPEGTLPLMDAASLEKLRPTATAVTVVASSEPTTVQLRLPR